jgi:hypothetical protein
MLDPRATRHPASDVAPDEEGYEQRQEQPHGSTGKVVSFTAKSEDREE